MRFAGWINTFGYTIGTFIPLIVIILFGVFWIISGKPTEIVFSWRTFFPHFSQFHFADLAFLAGMFFSFAGMEVAGSHAPDVKNVQKNYPRGVMFATLLVVCTSFGALAIAAVVPQKNLSLIAGVMQAFQVFFAKFHVLWAEKVIAILIVFGAILASNSTIIGPSKGLFGAAVSGEIPPILTKVNKHGMPVNMFIFQGIVVSILSLLFLLMPTVNVSYWLIMAMVTIIYLIMYILLFISGIVLRYTKPNVIRGYRIPGKNIGMWIIALLGLASTTFIIMMSFFPPDQIPIKNIWLFEGLLVIGVLFCVGLGLVIYLARKPSWSIDVDLKSGERK